MENQHFLRLNALRGIMASRGLDAVVIRGNDPHGSECLVPRYQAVTWLSGFTGEAGDIAVTMDEAGMWTDSRYFIQAAGQLEGSGFTLRKTRIPGEETIPEFLARKGCLHIACDPLCESAESMSELAPEDRLVPIPDLVDCIWQDRPDLPSTPILTLDEESTGMTRLEKIEWLRSCIGENGYMLLSVLDDIAWMLNIRGSDIDYTPVVFSYLLVGQDSVQWFVRKGEDYDDDSTDSFDLLQEEGVSIEYYESLEDELTRLTSQGFDVHYDPSTLNAHLCGLLSNMACTAVESPVPLKKSVKTSQEIEGMREAFLEDGLAMEKFLYWLESTLRERPVSEAEAARVLGGLRAEIPGYRSDSFATISAWGPNAALPHYITPSDDSTFIRNHGLYLCDSGGQYLFGTTDITRTIPVGETTDLEKTDYTLVLKGMIDLSTAVFPYGTAGCQIDALAREPMWKAGRNFGHGTGHGIGFFLCCHEGPQSIRQNYLRQALLPGMITSNEPGLYRENMHGIRHENVILCRDAYENEFGRWLCFETLTCCHIDTRAVLPELLTKEELDWLNAYNEGVYRRYASAIEDEALKSWLRERTLPL